MLSQPEVAALLNQVNIEVEGAKALEVLVQAALEHTQSRNVLFARMNDELGALTVTHGAGEDFSTDILGNTIRIGARAGQGIVGYVAAKGSSYVASNVHDEPLYKPLFESSQSEVALPIRDRHGRIRAVLNAESDVPERYGQDELETLEIIASMAGLVISRDELQAREEALIAIGDAIERATSEQELLSKLLNIAGDTLRFQTCAIFLFDKDSGEYKLRAGTGSLADKVDHLGYAPGDGMTGWVAAQGKPVRLDNPQNDARWRGRVLEMPSDTVAAYLAVPIMLRGESIGAIRVVRRLGDNPHHDNSFTPDDERILTAIADEMASGLEAIRTLRQVSRVERMAAWGELSAKSSHMIGNRVFALSGDVNELGHVLNEPELDRETLQQLHGSLKTQVKRIEEILQEFRDFVSATQISPVRADFNFIVREAVDEVFPRRSTVKLDYHFDENLPEVELDARKFRRAVTEIVENALSFFEEGKLVVRTMPAPPEWITRGRLDASRGYVAVEIADEGPGVEVDKKNTIFQPFYSSRVRGMGLGLSIVKGILEAHGGQVMEIGEPGEGARFVMLVPIPNRP